MEELKTDACKKAEELYNKTMLDFYRIVESWISSNKVIQYDDVNSLFKTCFTRNYKTIMGSSSYVSFGRRAYIKITYAYFMEVLHIKSILCDIPQHILQRSEIIRRVSFVFNHTNPIGYYDMIKNQINSFCYKEPKEIEEISFESINNLKF